MPALQISTLPEFSRSRNPLVPLAGSRFSKVSCLQKGDILATWTPPDAFTEGISSTRSGEQGRSQPGTDATGGGPGWISRAGKSHEATRLPRGAIHPCRGPGPCRGVVLRGCSLVLAVRSVRIAVGSRPDQQTRTIVALDEIVGGQMTPGICQKVVFATRSPAVMMSR